MDCANDNELPRTHAEAVRVGAIHYFTGKPCKRGHIAQRFTKGGGCSQCVPIRTKKWREGNPEAARAAGRLSSRKWRIENPEKRKAVYRASGRKWRKSNPEKMSRCRDDWNRRNPGAGATRVRNRRARLRNADGNHTNADILDLLNIQRWKCAECSVSVKKGYHVDHIIPLAKGGGNHKGNLQILCADCNRAKSAKDPIDFAQERGRLI